MNKKKILFAAVATLFATSIFFTSCSEEGGSSTITKADALGVYYGEHLILGLLPVKDTLTVTDAGGDSIKVFTASMDTFFFATVVGADASIVPFVADSLMFSDSLQIYAKDIEATGTAKLQSNKTTLKTNLKVDAQVYNLDAVLPGTSSPKTFNNTALPGTFNK